MTLEAQDKRPVTPPPQPKRWPQLLSIVASLVAVTALGTSAWIYGESRRELVRLATEVAELRLSLDLYAQREPDAAPTIDPVALEALGNRIAILEENWRNTPEPTSANPALSELPPIAPPAGAAAAVTDGDCLPTGTRFLVASGDSYPVCGIAGTVEIGAVDNGFISLRDGTVIAAGGNIALAGTQCMIGVVSAGEGGMTGYAEIRVTC